MEIFNSCGIRIETRKEKQYYVIYLYFISSNKNEITKVLYCDNYEELEKLINYLKQFYNKDNLNDLQLASILQFVNENIYCSKHDDLISPIYKSVPKEVFNPNCIYHEINKYNDTLFDMNYHEVKSNVKENKIKPIKGNRLISFLPVIESTSNYLVITIDVNGELIETKMECSSYEELNTLINYFKNKFNVKSTNALNSGNIYFPSDYQFQDIRSISQNILTYQRLRQ